MTLKRRIRNSFILSAPFVVISIAILLSGMMIRQGNREAQVSSLSLNPRDIYGVIAKEEETEPSDDDIEELILEAEQSQKDAQKSGNIREVTYGPKNANMVYGNVAIRNVTSYKNIDIKAALEAKCKISAQRMDVPKVLIFHTHTTESYELLDRGFYSDANPTRSTDERRNMVRVGDAICASLEEAGIATIHDRQIHDASYNGAYARSRTTIEKYKKQYPSLEIIIDVHRDGIKSSDGTKTKPVTVINGKKAAQIMIITGCSNGKTVEFPSWRDNLNFAIQLQSCAEELYPGLMRPIYFCPRKYNMDTSPCGILLEMGSDANTLEEAVYSGELIGDALVELIRKEK